MDKKIKLNEKVHYDISIPHTILELPHSQSGSLVAGENARRHFDIPRGIPEEFIPSKRLVSHCEHGPEMRNTRLAIHPNRYNKSGIYNPAEQRHFQNLLKLPPCSVKRPAKMQVDTVLNSSEYSLTDTMTRKKGVEKEKVRNLIPVANLGDKAYRDPSRSSGFFAQAGLIPGSTFCISKSRATLSKSSTDATSDAPIRKIASLSAIEKRNIEVLMSDRDQVAALTGTSQKRGQEIPSWESRTGMMLLAPDEEND